MAHISEIVTIKNYYNFTLYTVNPPSIIRDLLPQYMAVTGQRISFYVSATGAGDLIYQWQKDGVNVPGAHSATYYISSVRESDEGMYWCIVSNVAGTITSIASNVTGTHGRQ